MIELCKRGCSFFLNDLDNRTMHINKLASLLFRNTNMKEKRIIYCILSDIQKLDSNQRGHQRQFITSVPTAQWVISRIDVIIGEFCTHLQENIEIINEGT